MAQRLIDAKIFTLGKWLKWFCIILPLFFQCCLLSFCVQKMPWHFLEFFLLNKLGYIMCIPSLFQVAQCNTYICGLRLGPPAAPELQRLSTPMFRNERAFSLVAHHSPSHPTTLWLIVSSKGGRSNPLYWSRQLIGLGLNTNSLLNNF